MAKIKGKQWYLIKASKLFNEKIIGETLTLNPEKIIGRVVSASLMDFGGKVDKYYVKLFFKINVVEGETAKTSFYGHKCTRDFIARIVRKRSQRIDVNNVFQLKDNKIRVKAIAICNGTVSSRTATSIRKKITELLKDKTKDLTVDNFIKTFISNSLQKSIREQLSKIHPVRVFEIRETKIM